MIKPDNLMNWIDSLPRDLIDKLQQRMTVRTYQDKEILYRPGDKIPGLYRVIEGECRITDFSYEGKELLYFAVGKGDCFGEVCLIDELPEDTLAEARGTVKIGVLIKQEFDELCMSHPQILLALSRSFCYRLRSLASLYTDASMLSLQQRLMRFIHRIAVSNQKSPGSENRFELEISQLDLSRMLGVSRQSISKELKSLEEQGLIDIEYGKVVIKNMDTLQCNYKDLLS
jgi:CRP/FNR family cyclic AMP-dependent transcriptional regulator